MVIVEVVDDLADQGKVGELDPFIEQEGYRQMLVGLTAESESGITSKEDIEDEIGEEVDFGYTLTLKGVDKVAVSGNSYY